MANLIIPIPAKADLEKGIKKTYLDMIFATQDNEAHRVDVQLMRGKEQVNLSGAGISAYFIRYSDNVTIPLKGEASGNIASVTMKQSCYHKSGQFALIVKATVSGVTNTVFYGEGSIFVSLTDTVLNDENVIPSLDELLAQIAAMEAGTNRANAAADRCERMQMDASGLAGDSNRLGGKAPEYYIPPTNLLDNGDFSNLIAQAGLLGNHGAAKYAADRWIAYSSNLDSVVQKNGYATIATSGQYAYICQRVCGVSGKTITFAAKINASITAEIRIFDATLSTRYANANSAISGSLLCCNCTIPEGVDEIAVVIYPGFSSSGGSSDIYWAALYEGAYTADNLPKYVPKGYAVELAECERYYQRYKLHVPQMQGSTTIRRYVIPYRAKFRLTPTVTIISATEYDIATANTGATFTVNVSSDDYTRLNANGTVSTNNELFASVEVEASADL